MNGATKRKAIIIAGFIILAGGLSAAGEYLIRQENLNAPADVVAGKSRPALEPSGPSLEDETSTRADNHNLVSDSVGVFAETLPDSRQRISKKPFGLKVTPADSPVQPERFS